MVVQGDRVRYYASERQPRMADPSFAKDIQPLFRDKDRTSMLGRFDLWSYQDVRDRAPAILEVLQAGTMPCDGQWNAQDIDLFARWIGGGAPERSVDRPRPKATPLSARTASRAVRGSV